MQPQLTLPKIELCRAQFTDASGKVLGNLCWPCHKIDQGHPKVMIYINFVELLSLMLHAKFQNHRPPGSGEENF